MSGEAPVLRRAVAQAPVRVGDVGGWTDTWFGSPGRVCHLAVGPGVRVEVRLVDAPPADAGRPVHLVAPAVGADVWIGPSPTGGWADRQPGLHPLLEHAVASVVEEHAFGTDRRLEVDISSAVPPGASLGTSGAVVVALLGALDAVLGAARTPAGLAVAAHAVEVERAGRQSGVQDQWAAALGGCGLLAIGPYPEVRHHAVPLVPAVVRELGARLVTVVFGAHDSSAVHAEVIDAMVGCGGAAHDRARTALRRLSVLAGHAAEALRDDWVDGWAGVLTAATEAQRALHPALVGAPHERAIDVARTHGASGWKVNGAGGDGGSLTVVARSPDGAAALREALAAADDGWQVVDLAPAPGLRVEVDPG